MARWTIGLVWNTDSELECLLRGGESRIVERHRSTQKMGKIRRTVFPLINDLPSEGKAGVLSIAIEDEGSCEKLDIHDEPLRNVAQIRDSAIQPIPTVKVEWKTLAGCEVKIVLVSPATAPPVR